MHPELIHQMALERTARVQRDAERYRRAYVPPSRPMRTAIELLLSAFRTELERLTRRHGAVGRSAE